MGRGRAKAKQTKVARDLKYRSHETDLSALARELHGQASNDDESSGSTEPTGSSGDEYDEWSDYSDYSPSRRD